MCLCGDGSLGQQGHAQRQALRHQRVGSFDVERVPSALAEARVTLCRAQGVALLPEAGGGADFHGADREALEAREDLRSMSVDFFVATMSRRENNCMHRKSRHSQFRQNTLTS